MTPRHGRNALATALIAVVATHAAHAAEPAHDAAAIARGKYVITVSGCNDCHTPGGMERGPAVPEQEWLTGVPVGFQGPWGTTYASNLRLVINGMSEEQWLLHARQPRLPPMPWFNVREMTDADLKAIYAYVRSLGRAGVATPAYVAPGGHVTTPFVVFVPQTAPEAPVAKR